MYEGRVVYNRNKMPPTLRNTVSQEERDKKKAEEDREKQEMTDFLEEILRCIKKLKEERAADAATPN